MGKEPDMSETQIFVGVDVSKARLDVAVRPSGDMLTVRHDESGIAGLITRLQAWQPTAVVLEATGDLECTVVSALAAGACRCTCQSAPSAGIARATGRLAQTDALDAQILAQFGEVLRPAPRALPDEATQALSAARARRRPLLEMLIAEKQRHSQAAARLKPGIATPIAWLTAELQRVDADLTLAIRHVVWREQDDLLQAAGCGQPEPTILAVAGTGHLCPSPLRCRHCPTDRDSGTLRGKPRLGPADGCPNGLTCCARCDQMEPLPHGLLSHLLAEGMPKSALVAAAQAAHHLDGGQNSERRGEPLLAGLTTRQLLRSFSARPR